MVGKMAKEKKSVEVEKLVDFLSGISRGIKNVIGENAEYAIIHYGAVSCGKEIAEMEKPKSVEEFVAKNEGLLMHSEPKIFCSGDEVKIKFGKCHIAGKSDIVFYAVIYGILEGALSYILGGVFKAAGDKCGNAEDGGCEFKFSRG